MHHIIMKLVSFEQMIMQAKCDAYSKRIGESLDGRNPVHAVIVMKGYWKKSLYK